MYEIDFLPVGENSKSGDAIAMRFTRPDNGAQAVAVIDAGYKPNGEALVDHIRTYYATDRVDLAILTHPDGDHIGGMGEVLRGLNVERLWMHDLASFGGGALPAASALVDLKSVAVEQGTIVEYPWAGQEWFGGALKVLGPDQRYYSQLVDEQVAEASGKASSGFGGRLIEAARGVYQRVVGGLLGDEIPMEAGNVNPRNNSSMITLWQIEGHSILLAGDAGVPALDRAWDLADAQSWSSPLEVIQVPHHGSRRNCSSAWLDRILTPAGPDASAVISVVADSDTHPSSRVANAYMRRGFEITVTAGKTVCCPSLDAPPRPGWVPIVPLGPMDESGED